MKTLNICCLIVACVICTTLALHAQTGPQQPPEFVKQGQQLIREGKSDEALALYRKTVDNSPKSFAANVATGSVLDLMGKGEEARQYFQKSYELAEFPEQKAAAQRGMAVSYAFEANCKMASEYEQKVFDFYGQQKNFLQQGEIANEAGRICIDAGDLDAAERWYRLGHETGLKEPDLKPARRDLWDFRWEHALARLAARRGNRDEAQKHVAAARSILDKGANPEQERFFPYLKGYVAFYEGDWNTALAELNQATPDDPFIQCLIGQTYEKLGDSGKAKEFFRKAVSASAHNPAAAYAVPFSRKQLA